MDARNPYWGDFHTHLVDFEKGDSLLADARENIDFCAVLCYPFLWKEKQGLHIESVGDRPEFHRWWERLRELSRDHHDPGRFITFLGYEWHGDRTRYGDHNVIYFDEENPLDAAPSLKQLYDNLRGRRAFAIPHHTAYLPGWRGKDWSTFDEALSPVMELYSLHGSSEGCDTPYTMDRNNDMGPRTSGGSYQDALAQGLRIGVIGSNDSPGLAGRWGFGRAGVWAKDCTRGSLWEAIAERRTYAVTGDRIILDFQIAGTPMGSETRASGSADAEVNVVGANAIDRIELLHNGRVADTYNHAGQWKKGRSGQGRFKVPIQAGWGPASEFGFQTSDTRWTCHLAVENGRLIGVERCFSLPGCKISSIRKDGCTWEFVTAGRVTDDPLGLTQSLIADIEGGGDTRLRFRTEGLALDIKLADLLKGSCLAPLLDESKRRIRETFGLSEQDLGNMDPCFHNARKVKFHRAVPESGYKVSHVFRGVRLEPGWNYFYVRVSQCNGQMAWSSPIWVEARD